MLQRMCFIVVLIACLGLVKKANAAGVVLQWNPSTSPEVVGYHVFYGTASGIYSAKMDAGESTTLTINNLAPGTTYYFAATGYDASGNESYYSTEISYSVPSAGTLSITTTATGGVPTLGFAAQQGHWYEVQASTDLKTWNSIWQSSVLSADAPMQDTDPNAAQYPSRFYRLVSH